MVVGLNDEAKEVLEKSLKIRVSHYGARHPKVGWVLANFARLYTNVKDFEGAYKYAEEALSIFQEKLGDTHNLTLRLIGYQCEIDIESHEINGTRKKLKNLYEHFIELYGKDHTKTAWILYLLGKLMIETKEYENALEYLNASLDIYKIHSHVDAYKVLETLADNIKIEDRKSLYRDSLYLIRKYYPEQSPSIKMIENKYMTFMH